MKKINLLLSIAGLLLLGSCNKDEAIQEPVARGFSPQVTATIDDNGGMETKAGVIEDADYTTGEKFYWSVGDSTSLLFETERLDYAVSSVGAQRNQATFTTTGNLIGGAGTYNIYGFFPLSAWSVYTPILATIPAEQIQTDNTSQHLGKYMLMKAESLNSTVSSENAVDLNYKHLSSVLRVAVWNNSSNVNLKLTNINISLSSNKSVFGTLGHLVNPGDVSFVVDEASSTSNIGLALTGAGRDFLPKDGKKLCEGYMAVMPTATNAFASTDDLIVMLSLTDGTDRYVITKTYNIGTDLSFLTGGIQQGKSYYLRLKVDDTDLTTPLTGTSYAVGDYWPDATTPKGVVFWIKPGTFGTQGKVVGLSEFNISQWGPDVDEELAGVAGIRSLNDGSAATNNLITKHKNEVGFSTNYPGFYHIYQAANNGVINGVWYLPSKEELRMILAGCSGKVYESISFWFDAEMPGYNDPLSMTARDAFNNKILTKGGTAIASDNSYPWYWSSSEISENKAFSCNLSSGISSMDDKNAPNYVRWIRNY